MKINIYTDGSHLDKLNKGRLGCGGIMVEMPDNDEELGKKIGEFSRELTTEWLEKTIGTKDVSNPTAELLGVLTALETFNIPDNATVEVIADYNGVMGFLSGKWKSREVYIAKVVNKINDTINKKKLKGRITFGWVKGHQAKRGITRDGYWNSLCDSLAKGL